MLRNLLAFMRPQAEWNLNANQTSWDKLHADSTKRHLTTDICNCCHCWLVLYIISRKQGCGISSGKRVVGYNPHIPHGRKKIWDKELLGYMLYATICDLHRDFTRPLTSWNSWTNHTGRVIPCVYPMHGCLPYLCVRTLFLLFCLFWFNYPTCHDII